MLCTKCNAPMDFVISLDKNHYWVLCPICGSITLVTDENEEIK